ncbi:MAG: hypothetical protein DI598_06895 [Pseudopedobacter saltans]|uniref:DUF4302 domain-containing protein n=1 Tax=Pseudopedobacter saltans TaxID=151895 RepID=A0A2W5F3A2_9SPHI|nr:MAG: hypothetical protein DI598_06895 [Pseudopedobacter saltans]
MKKIFGILIVIAAMLSLGSCTKEASRVFDQSPQERMSDTIDYLRSAFMGAPNGWVAYTPTFYAGGFGYFMKFGDSMKVTMFSDYSTAFASTPKTSTSRLKVDLGAALSFDTYNYITEINNPEVNPVNGLGGDVDYIYDHRSGNGDSLFFFGKRYAKPLIFVKATAAQEAQYNSGKFPAAIDSFNKAMVNALIVTEDGSRLAFELNSTNSVTAGKRITMYVLNSSDEIMSSSVAKYAYLADQIPILDSGLNVKGMRFTRIAWKDSKTLAIYTSTGKEYVIQNIANPKLPLYTLMGNRYTSMFGEYKSTYPGTSAAGQSILNYYYDNVTVPSLVNGVTFTSGTINLVWSGTLNQVTLQGIGTGPTSYTTRIVYSYTRTDKQFVFKQYIGASGGYTSGILTQLDAFIKNNTLTLDYYTGSNGTTYGQFTSVENPSLTMSFLLR